MWCWHDAEVVVVRMFVVQREQTKVATGTDTTKGLISVRHCHDAGASVCRTSLAQREQTKAATGRDTTKALIFVRH